MLYGPEDPDEDEREKQNEGNDTDEYPPENMPDPD